MLRIAFAPPEGGLKPSKLPGQYMLFSPLQRAQLQPEGANLRFEQPPAEKA
jgi:hypothetical protein